MQPKQSLYRIIVLGWLILLTVAVAACGVAGSPKAASSARVLQTGVIQTMTAPPVLVVRSEPPSPIFREPFTLLLQVHSPTPGIEGALHRLIFMGDLAALQGTGVEPEGKILREAGRLVIAYPDHAVQVPWNNAAVLQIHFAAFPASSLTGEIQVEGVTVQARQSVHISAQGK